MTRPAFMAEAINAFAQMEDTLAGVAEVLNHWASSAETLDLIKRVIAACNTLAETPEFQAFLAQQAAQRHAWRRVQLAHWRR